MNRLQNACAGLLCAIAAASASAGTDRGQVEGQIAYHNDVIHHTFVIGQRSDLVAWTDSYLDGRNFDPIVAVWRDGQMLMQVDDYPYIAPGQSMYDSGLRLTDLSPGTYLFTIGAYSNFANGSTLAEGFNYDLDSPIPLADWCEPANHCNMGADVRLHWELQVSTVPEPSSWGMLAAGTLAIGAVLRRRRAA